MTRSEQAQDEAHLVEMAERLDAIQRFVAGVDEAEFLSDDMRQMAVAMALLVVGEAAGRLSQAARAKTPDIDWLAIVGLRNRIAHGYGTIDQRLVWAIVRDHAPQLRAAVGRLLAET